MSIVSEAGIAELTSRLTTAVSEFELELWVLGSTGDRIYDLYTTRLVPKGQQILHVLLGLNGGGTIEFFLSRAWVERPLRPDLRDAIERHCPAAVSPHARPSASLVVQRGGRVEHGAPAMARAPGFERNVRKGLAKLDPRRWVEALGRRERCVCRIEENGSPLGTGFLVGRQAVLTNYHVVERAMKARRLGTVQCRFDYAVRADGTRDQGVCADLAADPLAAWSPYAPAEATSVPDTPPPRSDELDFALLRLNRPFGGEPTEDARGFIALPEVDAVLPAGAPLLILQHPDGAPVKLALDTDSVIGPAAGGLRLRYRTNTDSGSSGSPCFTMDWDLVALHHLGDPAWREPPTYNQGIPAGLVRAAIAAGPGADLLGR